MKLVIQLEAALTHATQFDTCLKEKREEYVQGVG